MDTSGYMPHNPSRLDSWQPTATDILNVNPRTFKPVTPHWGKVMTFALERANQFMPPPPPAQGTAEFDAQIGGAVLFRSGRALASR